MKFDLRIVAVRGRKESSPELTWAAWRDTYLLRIV